MRIYSPEDINVISQVQTVALTTALPIILTIFKYLYNGDQNNPKLKEIGDVSLALDEITDDQNNPRLKEPSLTIDEINNCIKNDTHLNNFHYYTSKEFIEDAIKHLNEKQLLKIVGDKISLTEKGKKASRLLLTIDPNNR